MGDQQAAQRPALQLSRQVLSSICVNIAHKKIEETLCLLDSSLPEACRVSKTRAYPEIIQG
jgi:hypothetical protein